MLAFAYYLLKVIICSAVLFGYYWFFLRNKIFHIYNRFYLLASVLLSLVLPLLKFNLWQHQTAPKTGVVHLLQLVNGGDEYMDEIIIQSHYNHISKEQVALWLFMAVSIFFVAALINSLLKIYTLKRNNPVQHYEEINLVTTEDKSTPFSFLKNIFWNNHIDINSSNGQRILKHEIAHVTERHSEDKLFINIVLTVFWCNPIFWLLRKELNMIHEFLADKKAVEDGDTSAFAAMILETTYPAHYYEIANNFFYSPIKRRLAMLTKNNKTKVGYISRLLVLPLTVLVFAAFTIKAKTYISTLPKDKAITVVLDAGHGGSDAGGTAVSGDLEKEMALSLVKKIKELNSDENINIILTRNVDVYMTPREKADFAKEHKADLFISVHMDTEPFGTKEKHTGLNVWISRDSFSNNYQSRLLASAVINSFEKNYAIPVATSPMQQRQHGIWVLQANAFPSVLIEAGYLSNKNDLNYLKSDAGQTAFAKNVLNAIESYAANKNIKPISSDTTPVKTFVDIKKQEGITIKADSVYYDEKSKSATTNALSSLKGNYDKALIYVDGKKITSDQLKLIPPSDIQSISVKKENEVGEIYITLKSAITSGMNGKVKDIVIADRNGLNYKFDSVYAVPANEQSIARNNTNNNNIDKNPLYILNGKEISKREMNNISPNNIESINVIKNESGTNKYGSRAKDGVIEITMKGDTTPVVDNKIFTKVEEQAEFPGGNAAWGNYLRVNLNANTPVDEGWKEGTYTVIVRFVVHQDGTIDDVVAENYAGSKTSQQCIDLIKKGPRWISAKQNGHTVSSYRRQPITFVVSKG